MPNKNLVRFFAVLLCLGILAMSAPGLSSAVKAKGKLNLSQMVKHPTLLNSALALTVDPNIAAKAVIKSSGKVRPTGDLPTPAPSKGD